MENALGKYLGWKPIQAAFAFRIAIFFFGFSATFLGRVIEKKGPRFWKTY
jgi:hypothetical protein